MVWSTDSTRQPNCRSARPAVDLRQLNDHIRAMLSRSRCLNVVTWRLNVCAQAMQTLGRQLNVVKRALLSRSRCLNAFNRRLNVSAQAMQALGRQLNVVKRALLSRTRRLNSRKTAMNCAALHSNPDTQGLLSPFRRFKGRNRPPLQAHPHRRCSFHVTGQAVAPAPPWPARCRQASQASAAPSRPSGSSEPTFMACQPPVVTSAPEPSEVSVMVA
ncbi:MAG: hypothetical protein RLZZ584_2506 [Pseudomonadota bacterium]